MSQCNAEEPSYAVAFRPDGQDGGDRSHADSHARHDDSERTAGDMGIVSNAHLPI
jgi:hypothetical protein